MPAANACQASLLSAARVILDAALGSVAPERVVAGAVGRSGGVLSIMGERLDLSRFRNVYLVSAGKAALGMARAMTGILGDALSAGLAVFPAGTGPAIDRLECIEAPHPIPGAAGVRAARAALRMAGKAGPDDLFFFCLSGGASALMALPAEGITLDEKCRVVGSLLKAGADIRELNTVRKHLSGIKGGRLASAVRPAALVNLIISDVVGDDPTVIGSGPTAPDGSTFEAALRILKGRGVWDAVPVSVLEHLAKGAAGEIEENPGPESEVFQRVRTFIAGNNSLALAAAAGEAERLGFRSRIITERQEGRARSEAAVFADLLERESRSIAEGAAPLCLLEGGELTVEVRGRGRGGRNTEFMLALLAELDGTSPGGPEERSGPPVGVEWFAASLGTDGIDGPTDAAGAWIGPGTGGAARSLGLDPRAFLEENDSYSFFKRTDNLIMTGPTGTNVMDLRLALLRPVGPSR